MTPQERAAMQQALEALEELHYSSGTVVAARKYESATAALREALKPTREGKYYYKDNACTADNADSPDCICWHDKALAEQAEQEPVAWVCGICNESRPHKHIALDTIQYTQPVRTKDLTDDEIEAIHGCLMAGWVRRFARAVIAADREKNK